MLAKKWYYAYITSMTIGLRRKPHIVLVSAECSGLAQRGGLGGVVWGLAHAYFRSGYRVSLIMPYYSEIRFLVRRYGEFQVKFGNPEFGRTEWDVSVFEANLFGIRVYFVHNDYFFRGEYDNVYIDSGKLGRGFFEDDAKRFAFFCKAAADLLLERFQTTARPIKAVHFHDWHTAMMLLLLEHDPQYANIKGKFRTLYTIHNLEYQGTRPVDIDPVNRLLAFSNWYPWLADFMRNSKKAQKYYHDPHAEIPCVNPMRIGINIADYVTTVSPSYAEEITRPDDPARGFLGGRGLEDDLKRVYKKNRFVGIVNGIDYDYYDPAYFNPPFSPKYADWPMRRFQHKQRLTENLSEIWQRMKKDKMAVITHACSIEKKLPHISSSQWHEKPLILILSRITEQKVSLLFEKTSNGNTALSEMAKLRAHFIIHGQGNLVNELEPVIMPFDNILFFAGFSDDLEKRLYSSCDFFLMPSDFEPCGTSQMKSMLCGCLPIVSAVGGLKDTVTDQMTGFVFDGKSRTEMADHFVAKVKEAVELLKTNPEKIAKMRLKAMNTRFEWTKIKDQYLELMFGKQKKISEELTKKQHRLSGKNSTVIDDSLDYDYD